MEPWLDSLSEDWNSEVRSSSPAASLATRDSSTSTDSLKPSRSRIPHLAQNLRKNESNGNILRPRSTRGSKSVKGKVVLKERSASSLNIPSSSPRDSLQSKQLSTLPARRVSSAVSDSQLSVQHHTIHKELGNEGTPEWKRRIAHTEALGSDGFDLFSPSRLEGMFKYSSGPPEDTGSESFVSDNESKPWNALKSDAFPPPAPIQYSYRTTRSVTSGMAPLEAVNEEEELEPDMSAVSSDIVRGGSMRGLVKRRVSNLEEAKFPRSSSHNIRKSLDPRSRTYSGRQEMENEDISPITASKQNTIREQALKDSVDIDPESLKRRLLDSNGNLSGRPSSRSSDRDISYVGACSKNSATLHEDTIADITSQSLPEDLSVGTQDIVAHGASMNQRRGAKLKDVSFFRSKSSLSGEISQLQLQRQFQSSPPPCEGRTELVSNKSVMSVSCPESPQEESLVYKIEMTTGPSSTGSPLKLFGNRDTYTNNKLMRILTQYEQGEIEGIVHTNVAHDDLAEGNELRMSQFGQGDLDDYGFQEQVNNTCNFIQQIQLSKEQEFSPDHDPTCIEGNERQEGVTPGDQESHVVNQRSPKRRRTLQQDEVLVDMVDALGNISSLLDSTLAGKKRKDARCGKEVKQASPETLASRTVLRPKSGSRKLSLEDHAVPDSGQSSTRLTEALAAELENFAKGTVGSDRGSRKPSLATKDYMEEANKVMEFIRSRAKLKPQLPEIKEPDETSDLNPDAILDLEIEDSTKDSFSRPPSRERPLAPRPDRRHAQHSPAVANHLRKFRDTEDLDLLTSTFASDAPYQVDNKATEEAAKIPLPEQTYAMNDQESSPPGIRILNCDENWKKRKYSTSSPDGLVQHEDFHTISTRQTFASNSSGGSGDKGIIASGTVKIPDQIGTMTFDYGKQAWIKKDTSNVTPHIPPNGIGRNSSHPCVSEADPFEDIPDLSIDEQYEAAMRMKQNPKHEDPMKPTNVILDRNMSVEECSLNDEKYDQMNATSQSPSIRNKDTFCKRPRSQCSEASKHEERLHRGIPSEDPEIRNSPTRQARVVTIAFSSPIASEIPYHRPPSVSDEEIDEDDPSMLPLDDDSEVSVTPRKEDETNFVEVVSVNDQVRRSFVGSHTRHEQYRAMTLNRRPVSRIDEQEENSNSAGLSLIHVPNNASTPSSHERRSLILGSTKKETSLLSLTPLSDFTLHQADKANHPEESYVAQRANPKTLRQAHGSQALIEDVLVKAITDAEPAELFWERLRKLVLKDSKLTTLHGLKEYCTALEALDVSQNNIGQLNDLPSTLRTLNIGQNFVNDLTSWGHLRNLQYVDVSRNDLETLEGFSDLLHLRKLNASHNCIRSIKGIFHLDGLIALDVSYNELTEIDFQHCNLVCLETLNLSQNAATGIRNLQFLPSVIQVDVSCNSLTEFRMLPGQKLAKLQKLILSDNELEAIDISPYADLRELAVDKNAIRTIKGLSEAHRLDVLSARDQKASHGLVEKVLSTLNECSEIYLSGNTVQADEFVLPSVPQYNLRHLDLAACGLQTLPLTFGDHFPNLRVLNLNFNAVRDLEALFGTVKLRCLLIAKNRITKMRRTCLTLSRFPMLTKLDLRDNSLTLGFHAPGNTATDSSMPYQLLQQSKELDVNWWQKLDEMTWLRRRAMELLLAQCCPNLVELDGMRFNGEDVLQENKEWQRLTMKGVLEKAAEVEKRETQEIALLS